MVTIIQISLRELYFSEIIMCVIMVKSLIILSMIILYLKLGRSYKVHRVRRKRVKLRILGNLNLLKKTKTRDLENQRRKKLGNENRSKLMRLSR